MHAIAWVTGMLQHAATGRRHRTGADPVIGCRSPIPSLAASSYSGAPAQILNGTAPLLLSGNYFVRPSSAAVSP